MCRQYCFRASDPTKVECTLVHAQNALMLQSRRDSRGWMHPDGWGICVYEGTLPLVERRATSAFECLHFNETAERVFAKTVIAHVRKATVGPRSLVNTHPFVFGCWSFAHNGTLPGFDVLEGRLLKDLSPPLRESRRGTTDSELLFLWLLSRFEANGLAIDKPGADGRSLAKHVAAAIVEAHDMSEALQSGRTPKMNFLLTNGQMTIATRWRHSLHCLERTGIHDCEICGIPHVQKTPGKEYRAVVIASEPISHEAWREVPDESLLLIDEDVQLEEFRIPELCA